MDGLFSTLYDFLYASTFLALLGSFIWGVLSIILSPCHLSSIPLIIGYITAGEIKSIKRSFLISSIFSIGILITIATIGIITASLGRIMGDVGTFGNYFVAIIFFAVGLYLLDLLPIDFSFGGLKTTKKGGMLGALILGLLFGIALGPCTFAYMAPVLGIVFQTSSTNFTLSILYLFLFAFGHCIVIVLAGTLANKIQIYLNWSENKKVILYIKRVCGILVIFGGVFLIYSTL